METGFSKIVVILLALAAVAVAAGVLVSTGAPQLGRAPKTIGLPLIVTPVDDAIVEGFMEEMERLGYKEGRNVVYDRRLISRGPTTNQDAAKVIREMIEKDYDLLLVSREEVPIVLKETEEAGKLIPIVFTQGDKTVRQDFQSFKSSGKNVTGVFVPMEEIAARQLDFLRRIAPNAETVGYMGQGFMVKIGTPPGPVFEASLKESAPKLGFTLKEYTTALRPGPALEEEQKRILAAIKPGEVDAWIHIPAHFVALQQVHEGAMARRLKIPFLVPGLPEIERDNGEGLLSFGADYIEIGKQAAVMADKIFKGTRPEDIPIEFTRKMFLAFNLNTARAIELNIPEEVLTLADRLIEY